jgi:hypothetical protein
MRSGHGEGRKPSETESILASVLLDLRSYSATNNNKEPSSTMSPIQATLSPSKKTLATPLSRGPYMPSRGPDIDRYVRNQGFAPAKQAYYRQQLTAIHAAKMASNQRLEYNMYKMIHSGNPLMAPNHGVGSMNHHATFAGRKHPRTDISKNGGAENDAGAKMPSDIPAAKKRRLQTPTAADVESKLSAVVDAIATETLAASPDDTVVVAPTDAVVGVASLPGTGEIRERSARRNWKPEDDAALIEAVKKHGDNWVAVAALVPGRSNKQVSVRWRESLDPAIDQTSRTKINRIKRLREEEAKPPRAPNSTPRRSWNPEEDAVLTEAVKQHGDNWVGVAKLVPGRSNNQCSTRWHRHLSPTIKGTLPLKKGKWTAEEDAKLTNAVTELGNNDWMQVATLVPGRTNIQCRSRWVTFLVLTIDQTTTSNKGKWTEEESENLIEAVKKHGSNSWIAAAELVPGRNSSQCRQRWVLSLDPTIDQTATHVDTKGKWSEEEDAILNAAVKKLGKNWVAVAAMVLDRTNIQCRHRWAKTLDPEINNGKWSGEEDAKLTDAVKKFGNDWVQVAAMIPGRTNARCRHRWMR